MNKLKTIFKVLLSLVVILLIALVAIPYFFKDDIIEGIKVAANEQIDATLDFDDVSISLIKHFPNLMVDIQNASLTGKGEFQDVMLYKAQNTIIDLDLKTLWDKQSVGTARKISLINPIINVSTTKNGLSNYDIVIPSDPTMNESNDGTFAMDLNAFAIEEGTLIYNDASAGVSTSLVDMNLDGSAVLRGNTYDIDYNGSVREADIKASGIRYLTKAKTEVDGGINLDLDNSKYSFKPTALVVNDLDLEVNGWLQNQSSAILMDINFESRDDSFKKLWSLVPAAYTTDFSDAKITGSMGIKGYVRGTYDSAKSQLPSFDFDIKANNGSISYPGMPKEIKDLFASISITSPGPLDQLAILIPDFKFNLDQSPFQGRFSVKNASSNPDIDMAMDGTVDLGDLHSVMPMEGIITLAGVITTDLQVKGRMSDLNNGDYQNTLISGTASLVDFEMDQVDQPKVKLAKADVTFSPKSVTIKDIKGQLGETRFNADLNIENVVALLTPGQEVKGTMKWKSDILDLNQWMSEAATTEQQQSDVIATSTIDQYLPENFQLNVDAESDMVKYGDYEAKDVRISGQMINGDLDIKNMSTTIDQSDIAISGQLSNMLGFLFADEDLTGNMELKSNYLDLNQFMVEEDASLVQTIALEDDLQPIVIPASIKVDVNADIKRMTYDNLDVNDIKGVVNVANGEARMKDVVAKAFDGEFNLNGGYIGKEGETPKFDLAYTINKFNFQKTFDKVNTFRFLAPIGKFIKGNFNSTLQLSGDLTKDLMPDFKTIDASGVVETFNGLIAGFKPLDMVGQYFKEEDVKKMQLTDTKNYFSVADGIVTIQEFDQKVDDIAMKISGSHSLDQEINYLIKTKVPKDKLAKTGLTDLVDKGLSNINTQLNKLGFNINEGKFINLNFIITGTITSPKLDVRVVGMDGESDITDVVKNEINEAVETVKDSVKTRVNAEIDTLTYKAEEKRDAIVDTVSAIVKEKVDSVKADVQKEVSKVIKEELGDVVPDSLLQNKIDSILLKSGGKETEAVKQILKDWNPFKKKKKKPKPSSGG